MDVGPTNVRPAAGRVDPADVAGTVRLVRDDRDPEGRPLLGAHGQPEERAGVPEELAGQQTAARMIAFVVLGTPAPKGSSRAFYKAGMKRAVIVRDNDQRQKSWDAAVRQAALEAMPVPEVIGFVGTALDVAITFHVKRPAGHYKPNGQLKPSAPARPATKPDIDKLARTTLDAMTGSVFDDDSRIADLYLSKRWAAPGREGATITVTEARP